MKAPCHYLFQMVEYIQNVLDLRETFIYIEGLESNISI